MQTLHNYALIFVLFLAPIMLSAQTIATEEALEKACLCFNKIGFEQGHFSQIDSLANSCIKEALYTNLSGVLEEQNASLDDRGSMTKVAKLFYEYLLKNCFGFQNFSDRIAQRKVVKIKQKNNSTKGMLYQLDTKSRFPIFELLTEDNQLVSFFWIKEFDGSTRFLEGIKNYENSKIEIVWAEVEYYDPNNKKYTYYPEIILIEVGDSITNKERTERISNYKKTLKIKKLKAKKRRK